MRHSHTSQFGRVVKAIDSNLRRRDHPSTGSRGYMRSHLFLFQSAGSNPAVDEIPFAACGEVVHLALLLLEEQMKKKIEAGG